MYKVGDLARVIEGGGFYEKGEIIQIDKVYSISVTKGNISFPFRQIEPVTHLTTKDFIKLVEDMGYSVEEDNSIKTLTLRNHRGQTVVKMPKDHVNKVDTYWGRDIEDILFKVSILYANTPLELREEKEQLYTLELPNNKHRNRFYCHQVSSKNYSFGKLNPDVNRQPDHIKHFTQKEIDELPNQELIKTLIKKEVKDNE